MHLYPTGRLALTLALMLPAVMPASADDPVSETDALFRPFDTGNQPGAAVLVMRSGEVVFRRGYGLASLQTGERITPTSRFRLASVSKQFTAMAVARLAVAGRLSLDDPVVDTVPVLATFPGITLRHLLTHTSGLPDYYDVIDTSAWAAAGTMPSNADVIEYEAHMGAPLFAPGERYEYSNPAYEVLPLVIEKVTGERFAEHMKGALFDAVGMTGSQVHDERDLPIPERVIGYHAEEGRWVEDDADTLNGITGSGGQYSSLDDFVAWERALEGQGPLPAALLEQVTTRATLNDGSTIDYGLGWRLDWFEGQRRIAHGGSWVGFRTAIVRLPDAGLAIVILSNRGEGYEPLDVADELARLWLPAVNPATGS